MAVIIEFFGAKSNSTLRCMSHFETEYIDHVICALDKLPKLYGNVSVLFDADRLTVLGDRYIAIKVGAEISTLINESPISRIEFHDQ